MLFVIFSSLLIARASASSARGVFEGTARLTYSSSAGYSACGPLVNHHQGLYVSIGPDYWTDVNPNEDTICGQCVEVSSNGRTLNLPINDKCAGCRSNELMLSEPAFRRLAGGNHSKSAWEIEGASWKFAPCYVEPTTTEAPAPTEKPVVFDGNGHYNWFSSAGEGACGARVEGETDLVVGLGPMYFSKMINNPNQDPICEKCVEATYNGNTIKLPIRDKCGGCREDTILLSERALAEVTGSKQLDLVHDASWKIVAC